MATAPATLVNSEAARNTLAAVESLLPALQRLDKLLSQAIAIATEIYGPPGGDPFRGLYVDRVEVEQSLDVTPGDPLLYTETREPDQKDHSGRLDWLRRAYGLSPFDLDVLMLALAPELDRRYERVYAYLQNHVSLRRPAVDLALSLFCADAVARLARRRHFAPGAPLIRSGLLALIPPPNDDEPSLLANQLVPGEEPVRFLLRQDSPGPTLEAYLRSDGPCLGGVSLPEGLEQYVERALTEGERVSLYFQGPAGSGRRCAARALADRLHRPLLAVDPAIGGADRRARDALLHFTRMYEMVLYVPEASQLLQDADSSRLLRTHASVDGGIVILAGETPWPSRTEAPAGVLTVPFAMPNVTQRESHWRAAALAQDVALDIEDVAAVSHRFRLGPEQIAAAAMEAKQRARWRGDGDAPTRNDLFHAARAQCGQELAGLAQKIQPHYRWEDIVLPEDTRAQLHEICDRVERRERVLHEWGFARKLSHGLGINALFAGPSGTGKTMAAEIIANDLGLDLYRIDLSGVVSKYIGETEKNLARIFRAAENANAILFFDEADALFGKRSEVRDSHDRYANIEISYLLQQMESYEGLTILATNQRQNLDQAFTRRMAFTVHFSMPDEDQRREIWRCIWPAETPRVADADLDLLAREFKLSGGNIKNIALAAAYAAAADGRVVTMEHLVHGVRREYQKMGKRLSDEALALGGSR